MSAADLEMVSPMMVERRCPTCISLAMLGLEKSTITRCGFCGLRTHGQRHVQPSDERERGKKRGGRRKAHRGTARRSLSWIMALSLDSTKDGRSFTLMNPGPAISGASHHSEICSSCISFSCAIENHKARMMSSARASQHFTTLNQARGGDRGCVPPRRGACS